MTKDITKDMTSGSPTRHIFAFAVPMLLGMMFQQLYNMVDSMIVGKLLGPEALAAVGSTGSINFLVLGFCMGITSGFAIPVAHHFGAKDYKEMRRCVGTGIWLSVIAAFSVSLLTSLLCRRILEIMRTPEDIIDAAHSYIFFIFAGIPATILYNMVSGVIRSLGDSRTPVVFLIFSSISNIFLDIFFISIMKTGVEGAAYATVIAQILSGVLCLVYVVKKFEILKMTRDELLYNPRVAKKLLGMGIPMGLQYSITAIGSTVLQTFLNQLGTTAVAAASAGQKIVQLFVIPFDALGSTMATYCGQNVGAAKVDRLKKGVMSAGLIGSAYAVISFAVIYKFSSYLLLMFLDAKETGLIALGSEFLIIQAMFFIPLVYVNVLRFSIQGMGFSQFAIIAGVMEMFARMLTGMLLVPSFGYRAACLGSPLAWIAADAFLIPVVIHCVKRLNKMFGKES